MGEDAEQVDEARRGSRASRPQLQTLTSDAIRRGEAEPEASDPEGVWHVAVRESGGRWVSR